MTEIVVVDVGGTHARFAIAELSPGAAPRLGLVARLRTHDYAGLRDAWRHFADEVGRPLPRIASLALACPVTGPVLKLTNSNWSLVPAALPDELGLDEMMLMNDFGAVTSALPWVGEQMVPLCGPKCALPTEGVISVVGPGTGLGVALLLRRDGRDFVVETEGGHVDFAATDAFGARLSARLRDRFGAVCVERVVAGPGLTNIRDALAAETGAVVEPMDDGVLWAMAIAGEDALAAQALDQWCASLGSVCGDVALVHGASAMVLTGGLVPRALEQLRTSRFAERFRAKPPYEAVMTGIPVQVCLHPQPGLLGAAAAYGRKVDTFTRSESIRLACI